MMRTLPIILFLFLIAFSCFCQNRHDNNWIFGGGSNTGIQLNFDQDSLHVSFLSYIGMRTQEANVSISNEQGELLFFSNNCFVGNKEYNTMENSEGLNPGLIQDNYCPSGGPFQQSILSLPFPEDSNRYIVLHTDFEPFNIGFPNGSESAGMSLYYTIVDMSKSNGLGEVVDKNHVFLHDTIIGEGLHAVRHANGRDWWILCSEYRSNGFYKILFDPWGLHLVGRQYLGPVWHKYASSGHSLFSSNGEKYVRSYATNGLCVFDFDRCTGELSNSVVVSLAPDTNAVSSMALSASGRFAYVTFLSKIYQFDLLASDIAASKTLVATYDGFVSVNPTYFYQAQLAPDGKIYICSYGGSYYLHVIDSPDSLGVACNVLQHSVPLPRTYDATMPNFPNFRLGAIQGSSCDSIVLAGAEAPSNNLPINVSPNPASTQVRFEFPIPPTKNMQLKLTDVYGKIVKNVTISGGATEYNLSVVDIPTGCYFWTITTDSGNKGQGKLVVR